MSDDFPLSRLNERSREIFRQIVDSYLATGEPVGSRNIAMLLENSLSPASIRNVMADLEAMGLLYAPHISAGRLPTQRGLRLFIDSLMQFGDLSDEDRTQIEAQVRGRGEAKTAEQMLQQASKLLSGLSGGAGVVLAAKTDPKLKHIEFVRLSPDKGLVVLVSQDNAVENRIVEIPAGLPPASLTEATNFLNAHITGRSLGEAKTALEAAIAASHHELDQLTHRLLEAGLASWSGGGEGERHLIVRGQANLLEDLETAADLERIRLLFEDLERQKDVMDLLGRAETAEGVKIFIGSENTLFSLSGSTLITAPYRDVEKRIVGVLGVIGPTRLNYGRIVPLVDYTARIVGKLLS